jgi:hypothetical protein
MSLPSYPLATFRCAECSGLFRRRADRPTRAKDGVIRCNPCTKARFVPQVDNAGAKNPAYKHGRRVGVHVSKPAVRRAVVERDGEWCLISGRPGPGLHLHRVIYGSEGGLYAASNCVLLAPEIHALVHSNKRLWQPLLIAYLAGKPGALRALRNALRKAAA